MAFWKNSNGIDYYFMQTPESRRYETIELVTKNSREAMAEVFMNVSVGLQHDQVVWAIWNRGIVPLESQIGNYFKQSLEIKNEIEEFGGHIDLKSFGVLIVAMAFQSRLDQNSMTSQRAFENAFIVTSAFSYESAAKTFANRENLFPAKKNWQPIFYHIWAVRK